MIDAMDQLLSERQALDQGISAALAFSFMGHLVMILFAVILPLLLPKPPILQTYDGIIIPLPPGGGGVRNAAPGIPTNETIPPAPVAPEVAKPPKVIKAPAEQPRHGIPEPGSVKKVNTTTAVPASGYPGGTGTTAGITGLEFLPPGPGVPGGTDLLGDFYLAGVQRKIWMIWVQQIRLQARNPVIVSFTILADGSTTDIRIIQSSGAMLVDLAAQRAIASASPFSTLPERYGTNRFTIQAVFKPTM